MKAAVFHPGADTRAEQASTHAPRFTERRGHELAGVVVKPDPAAV